MKMAGALKALNIKHPALVLCFVVLMLVTGTGIVAPLLVPYGTSLGLNGFMIGTLFFGFYAVRLLLATPIGILSDRLGIRNVLLISLVIYLVVASLYFIAANYPGLLSARLVHGLSSAMMLPMAMAYVGLLSPSGQEGRYMGYYNSAVFLANAIGPLLGGIIADNYGFVGAFASLFVLAATSLLICAFGLQPVKQQANEKPLKGDASTEPKNAEASAVVHSNVILLAMLMVGFAAAAFSMHSISFFVFYLDEIGISTAYIGLLLSLYNLSIALTQVPFGKLADSGKNRVLLSLACIVVTLACVILPSVKQLEMIIVAILVAGLASSLALVVSSAALTQIGKSQGMGTVMGKLSTVQSLGFAMTPLISGLLVDRFSSEYTFYLVASFWAIATLASFLIINKK